MLRLKSLLAGVLKGRVWSKALAGLACILGVGSAATAEDFYRPTLNLQFTVPGLYNNNFGLSRADKVDGLQTTPAAKLTLSGKISENLTYTAFSSVEIDRYDKGNISPGFASDVPKGSFGLTYALGNWRLGASYTAIWVFAPTFATFDARYDDYGLSVARPGISLNSLGSLDLVVGYRERQATDRVSSNHSPFFRANWEKSLEAVAKGWTAKAELGVRYLEYDQGRAVTARDWRVWESVSLVRTFVKGVELEFAVGHEQRESNIFERHFDAWTAGATLSLSFDIFSR